MGARHVDVGQGDDVTWIVLADPEGNEFCVLQSAIGRVAPWTLSMTAPGSPCIVP